MGIYPVHGLPNREMIWQRIHSDDRERVDLETRQTLNQKRDYAVEYRIVLPDGTIKYLEATGHPFFSVEGDLVEIYAGTHVDVTERRHAREERERLRQLEYELSRT